MSQLIAKLNCLQVAKLLKHALKLSPVVSTDICLDLADIYCSLNRKSEAEAMFNNVLDSPSPVQREMAYRKFGVFLIKIGNFQRVRSQDPSELQFVWKLIHEHGSGR